MAKEAHSEQIKNLALKKVGRWPDRCDRFNHRIVSLQPDLQAHTLFLLHGEQMVGKLKALIAGIIVSAGQVGKKIGQALRFELRACRTDGLARDVDRKLIAIEPRLL